MHDIAGLGWQLCHLSGRLSLQRHLERLVQVRVWVRAAWASKGIWLCCERRRVVGQGDGRPPWWYPLLDSQSSLKSTFDIRTWSFDEMKYGQTSEECQPSGHGIAK